jgi:hypothetical protein
MKCNLHLAVDDSVKFSVIVPVSTVAKVVGKSVLLKDFMPMADD